MPSAYTKLAKMLQPVKTPVFRKAFVSTSTEDHIKVKFGSTTSTEVNYEIKCLTDFIPDVNDTVWLLVQGSVMLCVGVEATNTRSQYVDQATGNDTNSGAASSPLETVEEAVRRLRRFNNHYYDQGSYTINIVGDYTGNIDISGLHVPGVFYLQGENTTDTVVDGQISFRNCSGAHSTGFVLRRMEVKNDHASDRVLDIRNCRSLYLNDLIIRAYGTNNDTITNLIYDSTVFVRGVSLINDGNVNANYCWYVSDNSKLTIRNEETDAHGGVVYSKENSGANFSNVYRIIQGGEVSVYETGGPLLGSYNNGLFGSLVSTFAGQFYEYNWHRCGETDEPALENSWVEYNNSSYQPKFVMEGSTVHIQGMVKSGTLGANVFTLPVGYRPSVIHLTMCMDNVGAMGYVHVNTNGDVRIYDPGGVLSNTVYINLDCSFKLGN